MQILVIAVAILVAASVSAKVSTIDAFDRPENFSQWLCDGKRECPGDVPSFLKQLVSRVAQARAEEPRLFHKQKEASASANPFWGFIPKLLGTAVKGASRSETACFPNGFKVEVHNGSLSGSSFVIDVSVNASAAASADCVNRVLFTVNYASTVIVVPNAGGVARSQLVLKNASQAMLWDALTNGVSFFLYDKSKLEVIGDTLATVELFLPWLMHHQTPAGLKANLDYYNSFAKTTPGIGLRGYRGIVHLNESDIQSGDVFFQQCNDGLGTTIAMATGSQANHVAIAVRNEAGELYVCESTDPVIRCTKYAEWLIIAQDKTGYATSTLMAPLKTRLARKFNNTKAWQWAKKYVGLRYGYTNFFFGWVDTENDNFPCLPPDFGTCMKFPIVKYFFLMLERALPSVADEFFGYGINNRLNQTGLDLTTAFHLAATTMNLTGAQLFALKERDSYRYPTSFNGKKVVDRSMVCSTFACFVLREGGVFDDIAGDLECTEQDPWNMAQMSIYDLDKIGSGRPLPCVDADPMNNLCQLSGNTTFTLNISTMGVYRQMGNKCGSQNPLYRYKQGC